MDNNCFIDAERRFGGLDRLYGAGGFARLREGHVVVAGIGGVGSWCAEALARAGVGALTLIDQDTVSVSNMNRQLCALSSTVDMPKAEVMAARLRDAAPDARITPVAARYEASERERFFAQRYDYIADCIDIVSCKLDLIETALSRGVPILSALGTGNKLDPTRLCISDISKTSGCPLARVMVS